MDGWMDRWMEGLFFMHILQVIAVDFSSLLATVCISPCTQYTMKMQKTWNKIIFLLMPHVGSKT